MLWRGVRKAEVLHGVQVPLDLPEQCFLLTITKPEALPDYMVWRRLLATEEPTVPLVVAYSSKPISEGLSPTELRAAILSTHAQVLAGADGVAAAFVRNGVAVVLARGSVTEDALEALLASARSA